MILLALLAGLFGARPAAALSASEDPQHGPQVKVLAGNGELRLSVQMPELRLMLDEDEPERYAAIDQTGYERAALPGQPELPVLRRPLEVPLGAEVRLEVLAAEYDEVRLADLGLPPALCPARVTAKCAAAVPEEVSALSAGPDGFTPESPARIAADVTARGRRVITVEIWPAAYRPDGALRLYRSIEARLEYSTGQASAAQRAELRSPEWDRELTGSLLFALDAQPQAAGTKPSYWIVVADGLAGGIGPLVSLKQRQGYEVTLRTVSQLGDTREGISKALRAAYRGPNPPLYLLLVGDAGSGTHQVPAWTGRIPDWSAWLTTDLYYATMDGADDYTADLYVGRLPARNLDELREMIARLNRYEDLTGWEDWVRRAAYLATDDRYYWPVVEAAHETAAERTAAWSYTGSFPARPQAGGDKLYAVSHSAGTQDVRAALEEGRSLVIYSGHGSPDRWLGPVFSQADVRALPDGRNAALPFVVSLACSTSDFAVNVPGESLGETWVRNRAVAHLGASGSTFWEQDDWMERALMEEFFRQPGRQATLGQAMRFALERVNEEYGAGHWGRYYAEVYNLLGDPSLRLQTEPESAQPEPGECPVGYVPSTTYSQDFSGTPLDWWKEVTPGMPGINDWALDTSLFNSPPASTRGRGFAGASLSARLSPVFTIPPAALLPALVFYDYQDIHSGPGGQCADAALLQVQVNNGPWEPVDPAQLLTQPYTNVVDSTHGNPLGGQPAWCRRDGGWQRSIIDLSPYRGQTVRFAFRLGTGSATTGASWNLDDVSLQRCTPFPHNHHLYLPAVSRVAGDL